jgi:UDP-glucuronate 4-epimerase
MQDLLITGGAGFIGSNLISTLLEDGNFKIHCIDNFDDFYSADIKRKNISRFSGNANFILHEGDIRDKAFLSDVFSNHLDAIVHLAARAGVRPSIGNPGLYVDVNISGTVNLLEHAREKEVKQFVFASSSSVYGDNRNTPWSENENISKPISPYAATKAACEMIGYSYSLLYGMRFLALRLFTVFGPAQRPDLAIHKFFKSIDTGIALPFFGDGSTSRDYTFVNDIVSGIRAAIHYDQSGFEVFNLGNNTSVQLKELLEMIEDILGKKAILNRSDIPQGDLLHTCANIDKAKRLLNYQPKTDIHKGLLVFRDWYFSNK